MKKQCSMLAIIALGLSLSLGLSACKPSDNKQKATEVKVEADGTKTITTTDRLIKYNEDGSVRDVTNNTKVVVDPPGPFNEKTILEDKTDVDMGQ